MLSFLAELTAHDALVTHDFEDVTLGMVPSFTDARSRVVANFSTLDPSGLDVYPNSDLLLLAPTATLK